MDDEVAVREHAKVPLLPLVDTKEGITEVVQITPVKPVENRTAEREQARATKYGHPCPSGQGGNRRICAVHTAGTRQDWHGRANRGRARSTVVQGH